MNGRYDDLWSRLLEHVGEWASAREVPGGIEVTFEQAPGVTRTVEVVVTPAAWDGYVTTIYGTGEPGATPLRSRVLATPDGVPYLVYDCDTCDWVPSRTRELLPDDDDDGPGHGPGQWVVTDAEGNVTHRFADFDGQD